MDYINKLIDKMREADCEEEYIQECVEYAEQLIQNNVPVIFDIKHLAALMGYETTEVAFYLFADETSYYKEIRIPKRSGSTRVISIPSQRLKNMQRWILDNILKRYQLHDCCYGFRNGKSIYDNAVVHVGKSCVLNLDIKDFFPTITQKDVFYIFYNKGYTKKISYYLAKLLTKDGVLPQGSPASPMVSNIVAYHLDKRLEAIAAKYHACYSRYADDISFSGERNITKMIPIVTQIIEEQGFSVNSKKTRYAYSYQRQEVTGLIVNKKVSIPKKYLKELNKEIYFCKKFGVSSHLSKIGSEKSFYKEHLYGKVYFVKMIDEGLGKKLLEDLSEIEWEY